jgi:hypothetical protein
VRRILTILLLLSALLLGTLASASAQIPEASPVTGGWAVTETREIKIDGEPIALSPNGRWIAGAGPDGAGVCIWEVDTTDRTCAGGTLHPFPFSIVWAPDSSAVAFTDGEPIDQEEPNDLWLFTVATGAVTALDRAGLVHQQPVWMRDSETVLFVRSDGDRERGSIYMVDRDGGPVERVAGPGLGVQAIVPTPDGRLMIATGGDASLELWLVELDGSGLERIAPPVTLGDDMPVLFAGRSPDGRYVGLYSPEARDGGEIVFRRFMLDLTTGEIVPQETPEESVQRFGPAWWSDAPASIAFGRDGRDAPLSLFDVDPSTGMARPIPGGTIDDEVTYWSLTFGADGQVMAATHETVWLMTLERV